MLLCILRSSLRRKLFELREIVGDLEPFSLRPDEDVSRRPHARVRIQRSHPDVDDSEIVTAGEQRRATGLAEAASYSGGRSIRRQKLLPGDEAKACSGYSYRRCKRRPVPFATARTVAVAGNEHLVHLVSHPTAKTASAREVRHPCLLKFEAVDAWRGTLAQRRSQR